MEYDVPGSEFNVWRDAMSDKPINVLLPNGITVEEYTTKKGAKRCAVLAPATLQAPVTAALADLGLGNVRPYTSKSAGARCGGSGYEIDILDLIAAVETVSA